MSEAVQRRFLSLPEYGRCLVLLLYIHTDREVRTDLILEQALGEGKVVCMPANDFSTGRFVPSRIRSAADIDRRGRIPEPMRLEPVRCSEIDLAAVPGVVFDRRGGRIGMGGGFYDRFLSGNPSVRKVGIAFSFQVCEEEIPCTERDIRMDLVVTEKEVIVPAQAGGLLTSPP